MSDARKQKPRRILDANQQRETATGGQSGSGIKSLDQASWWAAHCRAAELLDVEPGPISRAILSAVDAQWRPAYLALSP